MTCKSGTPHSLNEPGYVSARDSVNSVHNIVKRTVHDMVPHLYVNFTSDVSVLCMFGLVRVLLLTRPCE